MSQPVYEADNYWQKLKDRMKAIFRQSPNMIKRLEQIEVFNITLSQDLNL
jgi:hypothetical protein